MDVLREMNKRYEVFIVSAATEFPNSLKDKVEWLGDHFPFFTWRQLVLCGDKKLINGDYMIDDHVRNLKDFNGKKYLYTSAHNLDVPATTGSITGKRRAKFSWVKWCESNKRMQGVFNKILIKGREIGNGSGLQETGTTRSY